MPEDCLLSSAIEHGEQSLSAFVNVMLLQSAKNVTRFGMPNQRQPAVALCCS
jgi:hypothetical protein